MRLTLHLYVTTAETACCDRKDVEAQCSANEGLSARKIAPGVIGAACRHHRDHCNLAHDQCGFSSWKSVAHVIPRSLPDLQVLPLPAPLSYG
jgi:hypothetical protein